MRDPAESFGLFVSSKEGQPVTRFGTKILIGAERDPINRRKLAYQTKTIVAIPTDEARKYAREYRRAIDNGSLEERTAAQWREQQKQVHEAGAPREKLRSASPASDEAKE